MATMTEEEFMGAPTMEREVKPAPRRTFSEEEFTGTRPETFIPADVAKSVGTGIVKGAIADTIGMPGSLSDLVKTGLAKAAGYGVVKPMEWMGMARPGSAERVSDKLANARIPAPAGMPSLPELPTGADIEGALSKYVPGMDYQPQTTAGRYAGSATRMAGSALVPGMGPGASVASRAGLGAVSGATSELGGDVGKAWGLEGPGRFAGAIVGPALAQGAVSGARNILRPQEKAERMVVDALSRDVKSGVGTAPDVLDTARKAGAEPIVADMAGEATKGLVSKYGRAGDDATARFARMNNTIQGRQDIAASRVADRLKQDFNAVTDAAELQSAIAKADTPLINRVYDLARSDPAAKAVWSPELQRFATSDIGRELTRRVEKIATDPGSEIVGRVNTRKSAPFESPNLAFWDQVKRELDNKLGSARTSQQNEEVRRLAGLKNDLVSHLDAAVPSYKTARETFGESMGFRNAVEAGYETLKRGDAFASRDLLSQFNKLDNNTKGLFQVGVSSRLAEIAAEPNGIAKLSKTLSAPEMQKRMNAIFGDQRFAKMYGHVVAENALAKMKPFTAVEHQSRPSVTEGMASAMAGAGAASFMPGALGSVVWHAAGAGGAAALDIGIRAARGARERAIAPHIMSLLSSSDPADIARLGKLAMTQPDAQKFLERAITTMARAGVTYERSKGEERPARASGGAVNDHEAAADRLIAAAEKAKAGLQRATEPLLQHDDTTIARALEVAYQAV